MSTKYSQQASPRVIMPPRPDSSSNATTSNAHSRMPSSSKSALSLNGDAQVFVPGAAVIPSRAVKASTASDAVPPKSGSKKKPKKVKKKKGKTEVSSNSRSISPASEDFYPVSVMNTASNITEHRSSPAEPALAANADGVVVGVSTRNTTHYLRVEAEAGSRFFKGASILDGVVVPGGTYEATRNTPEWNTHVVQNGGAAGPYVQSDGSVQIFICSNSLGYAAKLRQMFTTLEQPAVVQFIDRAEYGYADEHCKRVPSEDGSMHVTAIHQGDAAHMDASKMASIIRTELDTRCVINHTGMGRNIKQNDYPRIRAIECTGTDGSRYDFHVEADEVTDATFLIDTFAAGSAACTEAISDVHLLADAYDSCHEPELFFADGADGNGFAAGDWQHVTYAAGANMVRGPQHASHNSTTSFVSQSGHTCMVVDEFGNQQLMPGIVRLNPINRGPRGHTHWSSEGESSNHRRTGSTSPQSTHGYQLPGVYGPKYLGVREPDCQWQPQNVNIEKIRRGMDVRTTLMIRNTPTNWVADDIVRVLNQTHFGLYDFTYVRQDFGRGCAVGYVFVNFINVDALKTFCEHWVPNGVPSRHFPLNTMLPPTRGNRFHKAVGVCYANTQGLECLIAKFRNSVIMTEALPARPLLWWSNDDADGAHPVGTKRDFPGPDNQMKLQRSIENAAYQGLYQNNERASGRNRRQQSHYDRGTTHQIRDEAHHNQYHAVGPQMGNQVHGQRHQQQHGQWQQHGGFQYQGHFNHPAGFQQQGGFQNQGQFVHPTAFQNHGGFQHQGQLHHPAGFQQQGGYNYQPQQDYYDQQYPNQMGTQHGNGHFPPGNFHHQLSMQMPMINNGYGQMPQQQQMVPHQMHHGQQMVPAYQGVQQYQQHAQLHPGSMMRTNTNGLLGNRWNIVPDSRCVAASESQDARNSTTGAGDVGRNSV